MRYQLELDQLDEPVRNLVDLARNRTVTLLYGAQDRHRNNAVALQAYLDRQIAHAES